MKVPSSGRKGYLPKKPSSAILKKLLPKPAKPLGLEVAEWAASAGMSTNVDWRAMDDDEVRGVASVELATALGVPQTAAPRLVAKIAGLVASRKAWARGERERLRGLVLSMLRRDHELRLSREVQQQYATCGDCGEAKERCTLAVQRRVVREAGFAGGEATVGLDLLRSALSLFPDDEEVKSAAFYLANNIHIRCPLPLGAPPPDLTLHEVAVAACGPPEGRPCSLAELASAADLTILCAGSATWPPFRHDAPRLCRASARSSGRPPPRRRRGAGGSVGSASTAEAPAAEARAGEARGGCAVQWAVVYICEAHASDTWPLKFSFERPSPRSLAQRAAYAAEAAAELGFASAGFRLLVDGMDDRFNAVFGAWPTAYYALDRQGNLVMVGEGAEGAYSYDVAEVCAFVDEYSREFARKKRRSAA